MSCQDHRNGKCQRCIGPEVDTCKDYYNEYKEECDAVNTIKISEIKSSDIDSLMEVYDSVLKKEKKMRSCISLRDFHTNYCIDPKCRDKGHEEYKNLINNGLNQLLKKKELLEARIEKEKLKLKDKLEMKERKIDSLIDEKNEILNKLSKLNTD